MSITSLCSNCPDDNSLDINFGQFSNSSFLIKNNGNILYDFMLNDLSINHTKFSIQEFSIPGLLTLSSTPDVINLIYGNIAEPDDEVKLLIIKPEYDSNVELYEKIVQWRVSGETTWNNLNSLLFLSGTENNPNIVGISNKIPEIQLRNTTLHNVNFKILICV